ncbi:MAG TPA: hypothetical protein VGV35_02780 [Bryobacteraceae bacterium]|nr:hypothetical protein [Bryobacteraceae bacterium]
MLGSWESVQARPDGAVERVQLADDGIGTGGIRIVKESAVTRKGRYRLDGRNLHVLFDDDALEMIIPMLFEGDRLFLEAPRPTRLKRQWGKQGRPSPSIVGRWRKENANGRAAVWEFRDNGSVLTEELEGIREGSYEKRKGGELRVSWMNAPGSAPDHEDWKIRVSQGRLFITAEHRTVEYKKRLAFR